jgi:hypothetical protein
MDDEINGDRKYGFKLVCFTPADANAVSHPNIIAD